jgi:hypothetical protein
VNVSLNKLLKQIFETKNTTTRIHYIYNNNNTVSLLYNGMEIDLFETMERNKKYIGGLVVYHQIHQYYNIFIIPFVIHIFCNTMGWLVTLL